MDQKGKTRAIFHQILDFELFLSHGITTMKELSLRFSNHWSSLPLLRKGHLPLSHRTFNPTFSS